MSDDVTCALQTRSLGKRYGRAWALRDCTVQLPAGRVAALVGPNGAGKTTLLHLAVGLLDPSAGDVSVFDHSPRREPKAVLPRIGFVAQDHPLYRGFSVADMLTLGRKLNPRWEQAVATTRLDRLGIPLDRPIGKLSGGQQAQVALALALAKRPELILLDEPLASLDPLARREFLRVLMGATAESGLTVLLSSHIIGDLERVCDYLIILSAAHVQLMGDIQEIVRSISG
jgi:ABC-2 type transport system ATP-binding protein